MPRLWHLDECPLIGSLSSPAKTGDACRELCKLWGFLIFSLDNDLKDQRMLANRPWSGEVSDDTWTSLPSSPGLCLWHFHMAPTIGEGARVCSYPSSRMGFSH